MKRYMLVLVVISLLTIVSAATIEIGNSGRPTQRIVNMDEIIVEIKNFLNLQDTPSSYSGADGFCLVVDMAGVSFSNCSIAAGGPFIDTNASFCGDGEYLDGNGGCINFNSTVNDLGQGVFLNLSGTNANQDINITPFNFLAQNISVMERLFLRNGDHWIQVNASADFEGGELLQSTIWLHDDGDKAEGEIFFLVSAMQSGINKTAIAAQIGRNNSAGILGNSWMVIPNNLTNNMTIFSDCFLAVSKLGKTLRVACDTTDTGADLIVQDDIQSFGRLFVDEGIRSENEANFLMNGFDFDIMEGDLHLVNTRIEEVGFLTGDNVTLFIVDFSASLLPFIQITPTGNPNEWIDTASDNCFDSPCARASRITPPSDSIMEANFTTTNFDTLNLTFRLNTTNLNEGDLFNVTVNNNEGSFEVEVHAINDGIDQNRLVEVPLPASMNNRAVVSLRFHCLVNVVNEQCLVDNVKIIGEATVNTQANVTRFDTKIFGGSAKGDNIFIFYNDSSKQWVFSPNNISFVSVTEQNLTILDTLFLDGEGIINWDNVSTFDDNVLLTNGSRPLVGSWNAGNFFITVLGLNVTNIFALDWSNATIFESQIPDLTHTTDTNASTICSGVEVLLGNSSCFDSNIFLTEGLPVTNIAFLNNTQTFTGFQSFIGGLNSSDWSNVSITESQISNLVHTIDTNASTICSAVEVLLGNSSCFDSNIFFDNTNMPVTNLAWLNNTQTFTGFQSFTGGLNSSDWSNVSITESQISNLVHTPLTNVAFLNNSAADSQIFTAEQTFTAGINVTTDIVLNENALNITQNSSCVIINGLTSVMRIC